MEIDIKKMKEVYGEEIEEMMIEKRRNYKSEYKNIKRIWI